MIGSVDGCFRLFAVEIVRLFFGLKLFVCRGGCCFGSIVRSGIGVVLFG